MTPLVREFAALEPDTAPMYTWFDMSEAIAGVEYASQILGSTEKIMEWLGCPLPFDRVAMVGKDVNGGKFSILIKNHEDAVAVSGITQTVEGGKSNIPPLLFKMENGEAMVQFLDGTTNPSKELVSYVDVLFSFIALFLFSINDSKIQAYYTPIKQANHNKRVRQGKKAMYDWTTVVLEPPKPKSDAQGGSHASPRHHERRGHWRTIKKTGKKLWVKNCKVGDPALGTVFHDYKVKPQTEAIIN